MKRGLAFFAAGVLLLVLCMTLSCDFLFSTVFPSSLASVTGVRDLSATIPASSDSFHLEAPLAPNGQSYVCLLVEDEIPTLIIMDSSLNILQTLTSANLGWQQFFDAAGSLRSGNYRFSPPLWTPENLGSGNWTSGDERFSDGTWNYTVSVNSDMGVPSLSVRRMNALWADASAVSTAFFATGSVPPNDSYQYIQSVGVLYTAPSTPANFIFHISNSWGMQRVLTIPAAAMQSSLTAPLYTTYSTAALASSDNLYDAVLTKYGLIARSSMQDDVVYYTHAGVERARTQMFRNTNSSPVFTVLVDESSFYYYEKTSRRVYRTNPWW